jgi:hypothetical protein
MEIDEHIRKRYKNEEGTDTDNTITNLLDKGKSVWKLVEGSNEEWSTSIVKAPRSFSIHHYPSTLFSVREVITATSGGSFEIQPSFFNYYSDIRRSNQDIKRELCPLVNSQTKLLLTMDYKENVLKLEVLESKVPKPCTYAYYKSTKFNFPLKNVQPGDMVELHR